MRHLSFILLMPLFYMSCSKQNSNLADTNDYTHHIIESNIIEIPLDRYTKTFSFFTQVYKEGNLTYLVRLNSNANQLQFYNLQDRALAFKIKYYNSGPNGVGDIRHFYVHNLDSIFILRAHANTVFLTDSAAVVHESHRIENKFGGNSYIFLSGFTFSPLIYKNGNLYIRSISDYRPCDQKLYQNNQPVMIKYIWDSRKILNMAQFPNNYREKNWDEDQIFFISYTYNSSDGYFVFSYPASNKVFIRDIKGTLVNSVMCKSDYFDKSKNYDGDCQDFTYLQERHFMETSTYFSVIYDSYRQVYYRLALLPSGVNEFPPDKGYPNDRLSYKVPVIIVLDKNFNKIAEKKLPKETYMPFDYFVGKEGLYMSVNHDKSNYLEEDKLKFRLLKLEK